MLPSDFTYTPDHSRDSSHTLRNYQRTSATMSEVQFAKSFLGTLDRKPTKLSSDFVSDPRKYPSQSPYILPKPAHSFPKPTASTTTTPQTLSITLRPTKPPHQPLTLSQQDASLVTILDLKNAYASHASLDQSKIKLLYNKRPASDLKTLKDLLPVGQDVKGDVELSVMILGGSAAGVATAAMEVERAGTPKVEVPDPETMGKAKGTGEVDSGPGSERAGREAEMEGKTGAQRAQEEVRGEQFWGDLRDFLVQRLRDEGEGERLVGVFRKAVGS
ncbi:Blt1 N-terminal domain-containing protein [Elsinoe australis]|uniref:Blt1 N-terminal domain-containing protein n=1 Tax=Elsinoe australis TaxID=40998 RepID=A0A4U7B4P4_9PEZI|nr:Blt1 N-terminal domain-containing protein [Elsinoe australis]